MSVYECERTRVHRNISRPRLQGTASKRVWSLPQRLSLPRTWQAIIRAHEHTRTSTHAHLLTQACPPTHRHTSSLANRS
ncbi:hypothetical protein DUNSADRAFT_6416 [Dunaliella salina]|uniref:Encoded protein n=1 Tax=Dunaliella salina TaxID=3046 RepID=A0ABQ7H6T3_DUNSA|nr:hypothetical protein DUNSADRAFT_6416 [Dunaliella salina]|eukprot:KAF5842566.1 hypothetical protein DUNSADRAFT_6416 [Dunaliella salina]